MERLRVWLASGCVVVGLLGFFPAPGGGQEGGGQEKEEDTLPEPGSYSVLFALPGGGAVTFGIWRMMGERLNLGFDVEIEYEDIETVVYAGGGLSATITDTRWTFRAGPQIKWYFPVGSSVVPYARMGVLAGYGTRDAESPAATRNTKQVSVLARMGIGVEWFPVDQVSFGGFTGLLMSYDDFSDESNGNPFVESTRWRLATFHSGLGIQIYF